MRRRCLTLAVLLFIGLARVAAAQDVVFVVRHAERADAGMGKGTEDPPLSAAGEARAKALARMLRNAGVKRIFATQFKRTQLTAQPLAAAEHLDVTILTAKDIKALVQRLAEANGAALVVGHSDTVPGILKALGATDTPDIANDEYDNLFIVIRAGNETRLVKLRF